jgi:1,4-alpha-glucan branching enzyme
MDWVFQMNVGMVELARRLFLRRRFNLVHTHDWLAGEAGRILSVRHQVPLLATIHATEHGRNNGIHNDVQRAIDRMQHGDAQ